MRNDWKNIDELIANAFRGVGNKMADLLPDLVGALIILAIGLLIAGSVSKLVSTLLRSTGIDALLAKSPLGEKMNVFPRRRFVPSALIGWLVKWFFILVTFIAATNVLGWTQINQFLNSVALYIPNVAIAVAILVIGFIASNFVRALVEAGLTRTPLSPQEQKFLAGGADFAITLFAVMAALIQLKIAEALIQTLFTGIIFAISLAIGLAFGFGGKEHAAAMLSRYTKRMGIAEGSSHSSNANPNAMTSGQNGAR